MSAPQFTSVRAINKAISDHGNGDNSHPEVRVKRPEGLLQISRARSDKWGALHVRLVGSSEWIECSSWSDVVTP